MSRLQSLSQIFSSVIFRIPDYQRGYSWGEKQLEELWNDLTNITNEDYHFAGIITVERVTNYTRNKWNKEYVLQDDNTISINSQLYTPFFVVDGQQRLVSLLILISLLIKQDKLEELSNENRNRLKAKYISVVDEKNQSYWFGYEKDTPSHQYLIGVIFEDETMIVNEPETIYTLNLDKAKQFFDAKIRQISNYEKVEFLNKVINKLLFNVFEIESSKTDISLVFETLNYRGKKLSKLELFKNRIIFLITKRGYDNVRNKIVKTWQNIYEWLGKEKETPLGDDEFLKNFWIMFFDHDNKHDESFSQFETDIFDDKYKITSIHKNEWLRESRLNSLLANISLAIKNWFFINLPSSVHSNINNDVRNWLTKLKRNPYGKYMMPIILAAFNRGISNDEMIRLLNAIERHNFLVYYLAGKQADTNRPHFYRLTNQFFRGEFQLSSLIIELNTKADEHVNFENVFNHIHKNRARNNRFFDWNGGLYFLWEYEEHLRHGRDRIIQYESSSIDLVFPEPEYRLNNYFPEIIRYRESESIKKLCYSLGNLVITKNRRKPANYLERRHRMEVGTYVERDVAEKYLRWTDQSIIERGMFLLKFLMNNWRVKLFSDQRLRELLLDGVKVSDSI